MGDRCTHARKRPPLTYSQLLTLGRCKIPATNGDFPDILPWLSECECKHPFLYPGYAIRRVAPSSDPYGEPLVICQRPRPGPPESCVAPENVQPGQLRRRTAVHFELSRETRWRHAQGRAREFSPAPALQAGAAAGSPSKQNTRHTVRQIPADLTVGGLRVAHMCLRNAIVAWDTLRCD